MKKLSKSRKQWRRVDTSTLRGLKTAERLHQNGWVTYRTGLYLVYFYKVNQAA